MSRRVCVHDADPAPGETPVVTTASVTPSLGPRELASALKGEAGRLGFDAVGIAPAVAPPGYEAYRTWLSKGHQASMAYLAKRPETRSHPDHVLDGVRSIIVVAISYNQRDPVQDDPRRGKVARYARGQDYHEVLWRRLEQLLEWLRGVCPEVRGRAVTDTAPLLERDFARMAGIGWPGKNTMLIRRGLGSYTLLGSLLVDVELDYDPPHDSSHCGTCTRCLDACPTDAFVGPHELDSRKCLSYWTIEHRGHVPNDVAQRLDGWAFGCDVCQEVCPWNRKAGLGQEPALQPAPGWTAPDLIGWLEAEDRDLVRSIKKTAISRAKRAGLLRNAALVLGERRVIEAEAALVGRLSDADPVVRGACAWALGRLGTPGAREALRTHRDDEDPVVREAIHKALLESRDLEAAPVGERIDRTKPTCGNI